MILRFLTSHKSVLIYSILLFGTYNVFGQKYFNADSAFSAAKNTNKPILLTFSGSDWCPGCIRFHKKVLSDSDFEGYSNERLVLLIADFPQRQKQDKSLIRQNEKLADKYNPQGVFPKIILLSPNQESQIELFYKNQTAGEFLALIENNIQKLE